MAVIYEAQDLALGRTVAIKILRPSLTDNPAFLTKFRQEARAVANLSHPNIVTVFDVGQDGRTYYMVMEYIRGNNLKSIIRDHAPFPLERALKLIVQVCGGVGYAHRAGLVHADVKPQNVLVTEDDRVKVTDFGIARALAVSQEKQELVWGSPRYFAPEQAQGEPPSPAADVYAIGIVLFEMLTGKLPFDGRDYEELALAHINQPPPLISDHNGDVPPEIVQIVRKVMSKEPAARYRTADQLGRILNSYMEQGQAQTMRGPAQESPPTGQQPNAQIPTERVPSRPPHYPQQPPQQQQNIPPALSPMTRVTPAQNRPPTPSAGHPRTAPHRPPTTSTGRQPFRTDYRTYQPQQQPTAEAGFDWGIVLLAFLALVLVIGLIPLWIAVYQAWN